MLSHASLDLRKILSFFVLAAFLFAPSGNLAADPAGKARTTPELNSMLRLDVYGSEETIPLHLDLPGAGLLTLDATATGPDRAAVEVVLLPESWNASRVTVLERSATHLAAAVHGPAHLVFRVASRDPRSPAASLKILTDFTAATVIEDTFLPDGADERALAVLSRFYAGGPAKAEPEAVDPDPGSSSRTAGHGRLLASIATWRTDSLPVKAEPEAMDPDPGARSGEPEPLRQVLFYEGACSTADGTDDHADRLACATALEHGRLLAGEITNPRGDDNDVFAFVLEEPAMVDIVTGGGTDTFGELLDRAGRVLATDDDGGEHRNFRITQTLARGRYFVRIRGAGAMEGPYELSMATWDR